MENSEAVISKKC